MGLLRSIDIALLWSGRVGLQDVKTMGIRSPFETGCAHTGTGEPGLLPINNLPTCLDKT